MVNSKMCRFEGCGKGFKTYAGMLSHEKGTDHSTDRSHVCGCGRSYMHKRSLANHQRLSHNVAKLYTCQMCKLVELLLIFKTTYCTCKYIPMNITVLNFKIFNIVYSTYQSTEPIDIHTKMIFANYFWSFLPHSLQIVEVFS